LVDGIVSCEESHWAAVTKFLKAVVNSSAYDRETSKPDAILRNDEDAVFKS
jgi:hypothetical protein